jgi:anti-sigma factor RsiW
VPQETTVPEKPKQVRHISNEDIAALVDQKISPKSTRAIIIHLANCEKCRKLASQVAVSQSVIKDPGKLN